MKIRTQFTQGNPVTICTPEGTLVGYADKVFLTDPEQLEGGWIEGDIVFAWGFVPSPFIDVSAFITFPLVVKTLEHCLEVG